MKKLLSYFALCLIVSGCAWMQGTPNAKIQEKFTFDTLEDGRVAMIIEEDDLKFFVKENEYEANKDGHLTILINAKSVEPPIYITPNPTSSSITMIFWNNYERLFPQDINVELYYLDVKIHTFEFKQSKGTEIIPATYLEKDGVYRVAVTFSIKEADGTSTYTVPFMVTKGK
jgi:hypothetical protein